MQRAPPTLVGQAMIRLAQLARSPSSAGAHKAWTTARSALAKAASHPSLRAQLLALDAEYAFLRNALDGALAHADEAAALAKVIESAIVLAETDALRARIAQQRGDRDTAREHWRLAIGVAEKEGWQDRLARLREECARESA
jgi:hypothetical protein